MSNLWGAGYAPVEFRTWAQKMRDREQRHELYEYIVSHIGREAAEIGKRMAAATGDVERSKLQGELNKLMERKKHFMHPQ